MSFPEEPTFQESLLLIAGVQAHWMRLQLESPAEASFFQSKLLELFDVQTSTSQEAFDQKLRKVQLHMLQRWEEERSRLGEQLRAGVGQLLANAAVELAACVTLLDSDIELVRRGLQALEQELRNGLEQLRLILAGLELPQSMKELGLLNSLQLYAQRVAKRSQVAIQTHFPVQMPRFSPTVEIGIYRVMQEALHNAIEHSGAKVINLMIEQQQPDGQWQFIVRDEGTGFEPAHLSQSRGLTHMQEWARAFGGDLDIQSKPGHGTTVKLTISASKVAVD
ncbi:MAG: ATP-binding protein [Anaerolineae bacterium]|nr:ATP-binding protein [Anaerolineae bacterium]MDW8098233.1 ATP-binding protein [Anaerolineae bacterium]